MSLAPVNSSKQPRVTSPITIRLEILELLLMHTLSLCVSASVCACTCANEGIEIVINVCDDSTLGEQLGL